MKRLFFLIVLVLFTRVSYAHNGMQHIMGTVTAITDASITVKTIDGNVRTVALTGTTKYFQSGGLATIRDVKVGDRIVIHATEKNEKLTAAQVNVGAMKAKKMSGDMRGKTMTPDIGGASGH
jgi:Cu/Ag efflux protein CusF